MPVAREQLSTAMLDDGECAKAVIFEFKEPIVVIEWQGPFQERHWLELKGTPCDQNKNGRELSRPYN